MPEARPELRPKAAMAMAAAMVVAGGVALGALTGLAAPAMKPAPEAEWRARYNPPVKAGAAYYLVAASQPEDLTPPEGYRPPFGPEMEMAMEGAERPLLADADAPLDVSPEPAAHVAPEPMIAADTTGEGGEPEIAGGGLPAIW